MKNIWKYGRTGGEYVGEVVDDVLLIMLKMMGILKTSTNHSWLRSFFCSYKSNNSFFFILNSSWLIIPSSKSSLYFLNSSAQHVFHNVALED